MNTDGECRLWGTEAPLSSPCPMSLHGTHLPSILLFGVKAASQHSSVLASREGQGRRTYVKCLRYQEIILASADVSGGISLQFSDYSWISGRNNCAKPYPFYPHGSEYPDDCSGSVSPPQGGTVGKRREWRRDGEQDRCAPGTLWQSRSLERQRQKHFFSSIKGFCTSQNGLWMFGSRPEYCLR